MVGLFFPGSWMVGPALDEHRGETWSFSSLLRAAVAVGLLALLMGRRSLEVAFHSVLGSAQAFPCFSGKALQCWWLWI